MPIQEQNSTSNCPAYDPVSNLLLRLLPGDSPATRMLRASILDFCFDFTARTAFLKGPIGAGKSTVARIIGFAKRLAPLKREAAEQLIKDLRFAGPGLIDEKVMHWYVELALTGLVETLAESQLLGIGKGVATGVQERPGVFELAQGGRRVADGGAVRLTGGVVFLDEIAEISQELQAKLLPILSGGVFHRVGVEAKDLVFRGITIAASWRDINTLLRADLVSRLSDRVIIVPGLVERDSDILPLIDGLQTDLIARYRAHVDELARDGAVDRFWVEKADKLTPIGADIVGRLARVPWDSFGNMRGLTNALRQLLFTDKTLDQVIQKLEPVDPGGEEDDESLLDRLFLRKADGSGLANHVSELEREDRAKLRETLMKEDSTRSRLFTRLGLDPKKVRYQVQQLTRSRKRQKAIA
jgi:DNA-binding NtrC family response regulator